MLEGEKYLEVVFGGLKIRDLGIIFPRSIWKYGGILHLKLHKENTHRMLSIVVLLKLLSKTKMEKFPISLRDIILTI